MRCSAFEPLLDEYVDGALPSRERALVAAHVAGCTNCRGLLDELRVIDALLLAPRQLEPAPNFSFKVMAEVRSLPRPHVHRLPALRVLLAYLAFAWVAIGGFFVFGGRAASAVPAVLLALAAHARDSIGALGSATANLFGPHTFGITAAMSGLLAVDLIALLAVAAAVYARRRALAAVAVRTERC